jgi:plastocyanin
MLRRGITGRRLWLAIAVAALGAMVYAGIALAAGSTIVGQADNTFDANTYTIDQGQVAQLQVTGSSHNATANQTGPDGKALFRSPTISGGAAGVNGTQYLSTGNYTFLCTIHPSTMQATLQVTGNGTPQARPQATLTGKKTSVAKAIKKGILVGVNASTKIDGATLTAKLGKTTIGKATVSLAAGAQTDRVKLNKAGKSKLRGKSKAKVSVIADIPFGFPATAKVKLS